jgi:hypothetical protein
VPFGVISGYPRCRPRRSRVPACALDREARYECQDSCRYPVCSRMISRPTAHATAARSACWLEVRFGALLAESGQAGFGQFLTVLRASALSQYRGTSTLRPSRTNRAGAYRRRSFAGSASRLPTQSANSALSANGQVAVLACCFSCVLNPRSPEVRSKGADRERSGVSRPEPQSSASEP